MLVRSTGGTRRARTLPADTAATPRRPRRRRSPGSGRTAPTRSGTSIIRTCATLVESSGAGRHRCAALARRRQQRRDPQMPSQAYQPTARVVQPYPVDEVEFQPDAAYALYNWELFFHIPLLIATRLSANQRFAEAQRWFHYIFHPTGASGGEVPQRYWRTMPFHDARGRDYEAESVKATRAARGRGTPAGLRDRRERLARAIRSVPYAVARLRTTALPEDRGDEVPRQPDRLGRSAVPARDASSRSTRRRSSTCWPRRSSAAGPRSSRRTSSRRCRRSTASTQLGLLEQRA